MLTTSSIPLMLCTRAALYERPAHCTSRGPPPTSRPRSLVALLYPSSSLSAPSPLPLSLSLPLFPHFPRFPLSLPCNCRFAQVGMLVFNKLAIEARTIETSSKGSFYFFSLSLSLSINEQYIYIYIYKNM